MKRIVNSLIIPVALCVVLSAGLLFSGCADISFLNNIGSGEAAAEESSSYSISINYPEKDDSEETTEEMEIIEDAEEESVEEVPDIDPELDAEVQKRLSIQYITPSEYSRPGDTLTEVNNIVVHYLGNPGTTGQENRDYFDSLAYSGEEYASTHFVIGLEGEIIQLIPLDEISYCSNDRNYDTVAIECCHPDESGVFTDATYESLVLLTAWLCEYFELDYTDVIRHYDVTGKICPRAFVENADYYYSFKTDVANTMGNDVTAEEVAAICDDSFMDPEETERYFAEEYEEEFWVPGPPGGSHEGGPGGRPPR